MLKSGNSEMPKFRKGLAGAATENKALRWITPSYGELRRKKISAVVRALAIRGGKSKATST